MSKSKLSNLGLRVLSAAIALPVVLWMLYSETAFLFDTFVVALSLLACHELSAMTLSEGRWPLRAWCTLSTLALCGALCFAPQLAGLDPAQLFLGLLLAHCVASPLVSLSQAESIETADRRSAWLLSAPIYLALCFSALAKLHQLPEGGHWVLLSMACAWGSDTGAYFAGKRFGRRKLYPLVSPNKTVEGAIGGLVSVSLLAFLIRALFLPSLPAIHTLAIALSAGSVGQLGDLFISLLKRSTGVKDTGKLIPGHGGLLDRVDALMLTAPMVYLYASWILGIQPTG